MGRGGGGLGGVVGGQEGGGVAANVVRGLLVARCCQWLP